MSWQTTVDRAMQTMVKTFENVVTYSPAGGGSYSLTGIYTAPGTIVDPQGSAGISTTRPMLWVRLADLPDAPGPKDQLTVAGAGTFRVLSDNPDAEGGSLLTLEELD